MPTEIVYRNYFSIARDADDASKFLAQGASALTLALEGTDSMAGSDIAGKQWGAEYDEAAKGIIEGINSTTAALVSFSARLKQTAYNWGESDGLKGTLPGEERADEGQPTTVQAAAPPSAIGDSGAGLQGVIDLVGEVGIPIPNGDTGKLETAQSAWKSFANNDLHAAIDVLAAGQDTIVEDKSPEIDLIEAEYGEIQNSVIEIGKAVDAIGPSCGDFKATLDKLRQDIKDAVEQMLIEQAASVAIGIALSFVTAGIASAAGAGVAAWRITKTAEKIKKFIEAVATAAKLSKTGRRITEGVTKLKGTMEELAAKLPKALRPGKTKTPEPPKLQVTYKKSNLDKKFDSHAKDMFGIEGNRNKENLEKFQKSIEGFLGDPANKRISVPDYHGQGPAVVTYNPVTRKMVMQRPNGEFWSCWEMTPQQYQGLLSGGRFW
ncbi:colicin D domain-containing protein [Mycobacteroides franklinii]|uniref:Colicin-D n=1 Tax=Mycobacteroides franklinii TaxID=948102 RepID=A0A4R8R586_9MYCO|nr:colicin D domain-containing protein [Mycobacteroides franklinii]TDZ44178.1 Colicin-D [Mycobacteroides franklinii]TDZ51311.1 Colicin-D [Mycobacteroides franklinii]TDZ57732.1 Colicin-D [Mycobacteroides franklinii]TDZ64673.1 Colicin-D [Mycobacteroides franklinii]TDZ71071.1 Colicin-D [Mycobacteroides franklinii]